MAVSKKRKRKLVYKGREFFWHMKLTEDYMYSYNSPQLHVVSSDKQFLISYQPGQKNTPYIIVKGNEFTGIKNTGGTWINLLVPKWNEDQITPKFIETLLDWCFSDTKEIIILDHLGNKITGS